MVHTQGLPQLIAQQEPLCLLHRLPGGRTGGGKATCRKGQGCSSEQGPNPTLALSGLSSWGREGVFSGGAQDRERCSSLGGAPAVAQACMLLCLVLFFLN